MKLTVRFKGGQGSGHHGHGGLDDVHGGSTPGKGGKKVQVKKPKKISHIEEGKKVVRGLLKDKRMFNIAVGLGADGTFPDVMNITASIDSSSAVGDWIDADADESFTQQSDDIEELDKLRNAIQDAKKSGWNVSSSTKAERKAWELKYYGQEFGGDFEHAELWAMLELEKFFEKVTGKKSDMVIEFEEQLGTFKGGHGSGHHGHSGRPGKVGGSTPGKNGKKDYSEILNRSKEDGENWDILHNPDARYYQRSYITELAEQNEMSEEEYIAITEEYLKYHISQSEAFIRAPMATVPKIVEDGKFKGWREEGTKTKGWIGSGTHGRDRLQLELEVLGIPKDVPLEEVPLYGFLSKDPNGIRWINDTEQYGHAIFKLKDVKCRSTFTDSDSLDTGYQGRVIASPALTPSIFSTWGITNRTDVMHLYNPHRGPDKGGKYPGPDNGTYWEAQIYGGISLKDIDTVIFDVLPTKRATTALNKVGIPWKVIDRETYEFIDYSQFQKTE